MGHGLFRRELLYRFKLFCFALFLPKRSQAAGDNRISEVFQKSLNLIMATGCDEVEHASFRPEDEANLQSGSTLEIIPPESANTESGMEMWRAEAIANCINHSRDLAPTRFWESADEIAEGLRKINLQCRIPSRRYNA